MNCEADLTKAQVKIAHRVACVELKCLSIYSSPLFSSQIGAVRRASPRQSNYLQLKQMLKEVNRWKLPADCIVCDLSVNPRAGFKKEKKKPENKLSESGINITLHWGK